MTKLVSLSARRWENGGNLPDAHAPRDALEAAVARIDAGDINPTHVIIAFVEGERAGFMQAGKLNAYAQLGLLTHVIKMMEFGE